MGVVAAFCAALPAATGPRLLALGRGPPSPGPGPRPGETWYDEAVGTWEGNLLMFYGPEGPPEEHFLWELPGGPVRTKWGDDTALPLLAALGVLVEGGLAPPFVLAQPRCTTCGRDALGRCQCEALACGDCCTGDYCLACAGEQYAPPPRFALSKAGDRVAEGAGEEIVGIWLSRRPELLKLHEI
jgi:hypothetical protein